MPRDPVVLRRGAPGEPGDTGWDDEGWDEPLEPRRASAPVQFLAWLTVVAMVLATVSGLVALVVR